MTIYEAPKLEPFAGSAPEDEIKTFEAWGRGLGIAFDETNGYPEMEGINGLLNTISKYILYLQQNGISEWKSGVVYPIGAGVRVGEKWYKAKRQNTNKTPQNSQDDWLNLFDAIPDASTTQKGIVQLVNDLTTGGANKALTAEQGKLLFEMFNNKLADSGFIKIPNPTNPEYPIILQWIAESSDYSGRLQVTNPITFPNKLLGGIANESNSVGWASNTVTSWGFDSAGSTNTHSVARVRVITTEGVTRAYGSSGRILVWGY